MYFWYSGQDTTMSKKMQILSWRNNLKNIIGCMSSNPYLGALNSQNRELLYKFIFPVLFQVKIDITIM